MMNPRPIDRAGAKERSRWALVLILGLAVLLVGGILAAGLMLRDQWTRGFSGSIESVTTASLQSLHEQAQLTPFVARFVAVTTSEQSRFGLTAKQTMILPGTVRYDLDLNQISRDDLHWDEATSTLDVTLPPLTLAGPEIDLKAMQAYDGGGLLMALTDAEKALDAQDRAQGQAELIKQARGAVPMRLAQQAAIAAIERSFVMPLRAVGLDATVHAHFAEEAQR